MRNQCCQNNGHDKDNEKHEKENPKLRDVWREERRLSDTIYKGYERV